MNPLYSSLFGRFQKLPPTRRTLLTILLLFSALLLLSWINRPGPSLHVDFVPNSSPSRNPTTPPGPPNDQDLKKQWEAIRTLPKESLAVPQALSGGVVDWAGKATEGPAPYIAQAAEVAVATKEFKKSRASLEGILDRHHAYAAKLRMVGEPSGSTLLATLRVPAPEFSATVDDLKGLGSVEREEQTADEITAQRADVEARLRNAQNTLARLKDMLQQGWKAGNPAEIQRQLSSASSEIARLEAEKSATDHRVLFSQVLFALREEIVPPAESFSGQLRSATIAGLSDGLTTLSGMLFFVVSRGPATLLWVLVLYFPAKWLWRKWRNVQTGNEELQHGI
jgi:hypothetical protein